LLYMVDREVAQQAHAASVGSRISICIGGKSSPAQGSPVEGSAEVITLSDGAFAYNGPMFGGLTGSMGTSAWIKSDGVSVVVVCSREQPFDQAFARSLGIDCAKMRTICVKSAAHFRAAFEPIAGSIHNVDAEGIHTQDFSKLPHTKRTRRVFPVDIPPGS
jgi:microcystin degradation protein MlrC